MLVIVCVLLFFMVVFSASMLFGSILENEPGMFAIGAVFGMAAFLIACKVNSCYNNTVYEVVESQEYTVYPVEATAVIAVGEKVRQLGPPYCGWEKVRIDKYEDTTEDWFYFGAYEEMVNPAEIKE